MAGSPNALPEVKPNTGAKWQIEMTTARAQPFASLDITKLIKLQPPNETDIAKEELSEDDKAAVYRVLEGYRARLLIEAELLEQL